MSDACRQIKPRLVFEDVERVVKASFGFDVVDIQILTSYLDQNFKVECLTEDSVGKRVFNLKILNSDDSKYKKLIEAEHTVFAILKAKNITCPTPCFNAKNENYFYIDDKYNVIDSAQQLGEKYHTGRLLEFIPGKPLGDVMNYSEKLLFNVGCFAGSLDSALEGFYDETFETRDCIWHLDKIKNYENRLEYVDEQRKPVLKQAIDNFYRNVMNEKRKQSLRKGMMHCDFNETNILVDLNDETEISGILDFGDAYHSFYVFEIAIASLYMMLDAFKPGGTRGSLSQIEIAAHVIAGYLSKFQLNHYEYYSILYCIKARIAQSLMNGCYCRSLDPENSYVTTTQANAWKLLCDLNDKSESQVYEIWNTILKEKYNIELFNPIS